MQGRHYLDEIWPQTGPMEVIIHHHDRRLGIAKVFRDILHRVRCRSKVDLVEGDTQCGELLGRLTTTEASGLGVQGDDQYLVSYSQKFRSPVLLYTPNYTPHSYE